MGSDNFCLRWNDFESNISSSFVDLRSKKEFFDVTLSCDHGNEQIQAHKVILAACSPFFRKVLARNPHQNPLIYLKGIDYENLTAVLNFMYHGEVNIAQEDLSSFLRVAEELAVKGLTDGNKNGSGDGESASSPPAAKPAKKLVKKSGGLKRPPMLQPSPNAAAKQAAAAAAAAAVSSSSSSPSALPPSSSSTALNNSSNNSPSLSKKPKMSTFDDRPHVVKPDLENSLASHEDGSEEMEDYGFGPGEGFGPEGEYLDDSMAADDMEAAGGIGMPPAGMDADGNKEFGGEDPSENYYTRDPQGVFWCANCPLKTPHRRDLFRHIDAVHMDTQYPCQLCGRVLKAKYLLERHHKKLHTGNRKSRGPVNPLMGH